MEEQHAIYCSQEEWLAVLKATAHGIVSLRSDAEAGDTDAQQMLAWADTRCVAFRERVIEELGMRQIFEVAMAGDHEAAQKLADKYADDMRAGRR